MKENYEAIKMKETDYQKLVEPYKDQALEVLGNLIRINSVYDEKTKSKVNPFGKGVEQALAYIAKIGFELGFKVDRCDNYCTELSYGEGKVLDIYAHLDVVPVNLEKWTKDPFSMLIEDGNIYGRGSCDDKGPGVACLFATKALIDNLKIKGYRVRFIFGGNEERGSLCLDHYFNCIKKGYPELGFSPDADYPLIYAEKSMANYELSYDISLPFVQPFGVGDALNIVLDNATVTLNEFATKKEEKRFISALKKYAKSVKGLKASYSITDHILSFVGLSAHGSMPYAGINAGLHMLAFLGEFFDIDLLSFVADCYMDGRGSKLHLNFRDKVFNESTYNVGKIIYTGGQLKVYVNARFPVNADISDVLAKARKGGKCHLEVLSTSKGFVFDKKSPLISILLDSYQKETGDLKSQPLAIGGGTYARESKNSVAFGAAFAKRDYRMHGDDEYFPLSDFYANMQIYAHAIDKLGEYLAKLGEENNETQTQKVDE